jgi:hypothetical protein
VGQHDDSRWRESFAAAAVFCDDDAAARHRQELKQSQQIHIRFNGSGKALGHHHNQAWSAHCSSRPTDLQRRELFKPGAGVLLWKLIEAICSSK